MFDVFVFEVQNKKRIFKIENVENKKRIFERLNLWGSKREKKFFPRMFEVQNLYIGSNAM